MKATAFENELCEKAHVEINCESSSVGRAQPCQGWGREFESRLPLKSARMVELVDTPDLKSCACMGVRVQVPLRVQKASVLLGLFLF